VEEKRRRSGLRRRKLTGKRFVGEALVRCHRCSGIMVNQRFYGPGKPFWGWRCLLCGEIFDPLISENRNHCRKIAMVGKGITPKGREGRR
jgi:DNA-directed RNA polymerase subunit RPC12/RpoP